jgi:hypothetical protein
MQEFFESERMTFIVNGDDFVVPFTEALLLSSKVCESVRCDVSTRSFKIETTEATSADFDEFLKFIRCSRLKRLEIEQGLKFLLFCRFLRNDDLALTLLALLHPIESESQIASGCEIESSNSMILLCDADIDFCASHFYLYSVKELRRLDRSLLHRILSSSSLLLRNEDSFLSLILDLGDDFCDLLNYVEIIYLGETGLSLFIDRVEFANLTATIWEKFVTRVKNREPPTFDLHRFLRLFDSTILTTLPSVLDEFWEKQWKLIYRGSKDGFRASDFHGKCNGIGNTVTIILTTNYFIFGSSNSYKTDSTNQSFLFQIKGPLNSAPRQFPLSKPSDSIYCGSSYGPTFGVGCDIYVADCCNQNAISYTNLGNSYVTNTGLSNTHVFTGQQYFSVKEIEVFSITQ